MSEHTSVPWNLAKERKPMIATPRWVPEAEIRGKGGMRIVVRLGKLTSAEAEANAEFIVQACNAHEDLLGALKQLSAALDDFDFDPALQAAARAAIANAEGNDR